MQAIFILAITGTLLLLPGSSFAETNAECQTRCAADKATRDEGCPQADNNEETDQARAQCLQDSENAYSNCVNDCPQPAAADS